MSNMKLSCDASTVEALAQKTFFYERIFETQSQFLRRCPALYEEAHERLIRSGIIGGPQLPTRAGRKAFMVHLESLCKIQPKSIDDRVIVASAAYGMVNAISLCELPDYSYLDCQRISDRLTELENEEWGNATAEARMVAGASAIVSGKDRGVTNAKKRVTQADIQLFKTNPLLLVGRCFVHMMNPRKEVGDEEDLSFLVLALKSSIDGVRMYDVALDSDCSDQVLMSMEEDALLDMLSESVSG